MKKVSNNEQINKSVAFLKAVAEPNRLRILWVLSQMDICVCALGKKLDVSHNLVSHHLKRLYDAGILDKRRDGNQFFYFIKDELRERVMNLFKFVQIN